MKTPRSEQETRKLIAEIAKLLEQLRSQYDNEPDAGKQVNLQQKMSDSVAEYNTYINFYEKMWGPYESKNS